MATMSLNSNLTASAVRRHLFRKGDAVSRHMERLASGKRINRLGDDAAGFAIAKRLEANLRSIGQARRNSMEALSLIQVSEGGMNEIGNLLIRMRELAVQSASDTVGDRERELLETEGVEIEKELERLSQSTKYFDTNLLDGSGKEFVFQVGMESDEYSRIVYDASALDLRPSSLGVSGLSLLDRDDALDALEVVDEALHRLALPRAQLGAVQTRLNSITDQLQVYEENYASALSRIEDAYIAEEATKSVTAQVQQKAAIAILVQANQLPAVVLRLLGA